MEKPHFLIVIFPAVSHINPTLQFAERLIRLGAQVTWATPFSALRKITRTSIPNGLSIVTFSDGYDDGFMWGDHDIALYLSELRCHGSKAISSLIENQAKEGKPISCLVYTLLLHWTAEVARLQNIPAVLFWIQAATVLDIYYYYCNDHNSEFGKCSNPSYVVELPCLPPLTVRDIPSFLLPSNAYAFGVQSFTEQIKILSEDTKPTVLVNTFDAIEANALKAIENYNVIAIGPLIPSTIVDCRDPNGKATGGDLNFELSLYVNNYLNSKPKGSVVYVSFGSYSLLAKQQIEEISKALRNSERPFLWVIREDQSKKINHIKKEGKFQWKAELEQQGMVVPWCSQVEVLSHESLGCFVTHCGWNSIMESVVCGVPVVAFPQWTDQGTNAKLIEDVWGTGVRVVGNEDGIVVSGEIERCLDLVMGGGDKAVEMRSNVKKWKGLAREAAKEGGSSDKNLKSFVVDFVAKS